ncbi:MAG: polyprenyl synthetase family protein [Ignavibacteriaceae bacterium]
MITENQKKYSSLYEGERKKIEKKLKSSLENRKPKSLYSPSLYILESGGKRLRPLLVLLSTKAVGGKFSQSYNAAIAVELLHNFTLVHDDIMDNADKRRSRKTLHKKYDVNTAILAGDSLLSVAYEYLLKDCNGNSKSIISSFTKGLVEVCEGQSLDKEFELRKNVSLDEYLLMIQKKTAAMVEMCCSIGAQIGGGSSKEIKAMKNFGKKIGIAFQIQDDLLDIIANENEFGKFVGGDLIEGKKTFLLLTALKKARDNDRKNLLKIIENKEINEKQIKKYKNIYDKLNVIDDAKREIKKYSQNALNSLKILKSDENKKIFTWLSDSLIKRIK